MFNLKFESCVVHARARTSNELKISIEAARLACPETKDETHFLPLPLFVPIAEFDPADQRVRSGKYSPVHDVIVPRPMSRDQKQKNAFYLNGLNLFSVFSVQ